MTESAVMAGIRLGVFQAHALAGPPAFLVLFATDHLILATMMFVGSALGWLGWCRDFGLRSKP